MQLTRSSAAFCCTAIIFCAFPQVCSFWPVLRADKQPESTQRRAGFDKEAREALFLQKIAVDAARYWYCDSRFFAKRSKSNSWQERRIGTCGAARHLFRRVTRSSTSSAKYNDKSDLHCIGTILLSWLVHRYAVATALYCILESNSAHSPALLSRSVLQPAIAWPIVSYCAEKQPA
jgi:hypothetical protein